MRRLRTALMFLKCTLALALAWTVTVLLGGCGPMPLPALASQAAGRWYLACGAWPEPASLTELDTDRVPCPPATDAVGCTTRDSHRVLVVTRASTPEAEILLHEFGHVLGARHLHTGEVGVMTAQANDGGNRSCITQDDLNAVGWCPAPRPECP